MMSTVSTSLGSKSRTLGHKDIGPDVVRFWLEVEDLVRVFGVDSGHIVQRLQVNNLLRQQRVNEATGIQRISSLKPNEHITTVKI